MMGLCASSIRLKTEMLSLPLPPPTVWLSYALRLNVVGSENVLFPENGPLNSK